MAGSWAVILVVGLLMHGNTATAQPATPAPNTAAPHTAAPNTSAATPNAPAPGGSAAPGAPMSAGSFAKRIQSVFIVCAVVGILLIAGIVLAIIVLFGKPRDTG